MASSPSAGARRLGSPRASCHAVADVTTGDGLLRALAGADAVIDGTNSQRDAAGVLVAGTRRVLAIAHEAGVRHFVGVSLVGIDDAPIAYCRVKAGPGEGDRGGPRAVVAPPRHPVPRARRTIRARALGRRPRAARLGCSSRSTCARSPRRSSRRPRPDRRGECPTSPGPRWRSSATSRASGGPPPAAAASCSRCRSWERWGVPAFGADVQHRPRRGHRHVRRLAGRALPHVAGHS